MAARCPAPLSPFTVVPMQPTLVARAFHVEGWVYEEKVDGYRMIAYKTGSLVKLISRQGIEHTHRFRDLAAAVASLPHDRLILDGEVAVFDQDLVSRFEWLRHINHGDLATPPLFMVFDLLQLGDKDYKLEPLKVRRKALEKLVRGQKLILPARRLSTNGLAAWTEVLYRGYEGMVAKDPESKYVGGRSLKWLKVKVRNYRVKERGWE